MPKSLKLFITLLVAGGALALLATSIVFPHPINSRIALDLGDPATTPLELLAGLGFWTLATFLASALPVQMPGGILVTVSIAPIIAATSLGGPLAGGLVALVGTTEVRELRGKVPWYGSLANHAGLVLPAIACGLVIDWVRFVGPGGFATDFVGTVLGAVTYFGLNLLIVSVVVGLKVGKPIRQLLIEDSRGFTASLLALAPLGWLMARMYDTEGAGWWTTLLFALPLYTTRVAYHRFVEMRDMFTQTIGALAEAVDKRDPFTSKHSQNVRMISVDIGREMRVSAAELEALEWGGLLHDVGKIGVPDNILLKQERLTREERMVMNAHPVLGAEIIAPVNRLAAELPIIRHHHEWYNGSGYPDRLMGDEIPRLARILHVADAFEAMTAARPYRMTPLTNEQALAELRKFAGVQFDPVVVDAFVRTRWAEDVRDPGRNAELRPIPLLAQHAARTTQPAYDGPAPGSPASDLA
jgi:putative nucleotidyltransferase with HDIG domain